MAAARIALLILKPRQHQASPRDQWVIAALVIGFLVAAMWLWTVAFGNPFGDLDRALLEQLIAKHSKLWQEARAEVVLRYAMAILVLIAAFAHLWVHRRATKYERLILDETGVRYQSPLPQSLRGLWPDWSLRWSEVRAARVAIPRMLHHPNLAVLELEASSRKRKIWVLRWTAEAGVTAPDVTNSWRDRFFAGIGTKRDLEETWKEIEESPVVRYAKQAGLEIEIDKSLGIGAGFALDSNRHTLAGAVLVIALLCYAAVDLAVGKEVYAVKPPLVLFAVGGAIVVLAGLLWFASVRVPRAETLGASLLLGLAAGFALYPGALRVNAGTDSDGLHAYEYRLTSYVVFLPLDSRVPELSFPNDADYWLQFKLGTVHSFDLRQGGLGFYQVDMGPVHAKMRAYFESQRR